MFNLVLQFTFKKNEIQKSKENIEDFKAEAEKNNQIYKLMDGLEDLFPLKKTAGGECIKWFNKQTARDVYLERYCAKYLTEEWINENLYIEEIKEVPDGYEIDEKTGKEYPKFRKERFRYNPLEKKQLERECWHSVEQLLNAKYGHKESSLDGLESEGWISFEDPLVDTEDFKESLLYKKSEEMWVYLEELLDGINEFDGKNREKGIQRYLKFCQYIRKQALYTEYKEIMDRLFGLVLRSR